MSEADLEVHDGSQPWRTCRLGDLLTEVNVRVKDLSDGDQLDLEVLSLTKNDGLIPQSDRFNHRVATEDVSKYKIVERDWIVYNPYVIWEGAIHRQRRFDRGVVSPAYRVWERNETDGGFVDYLLRSDCMIEKYNQLSRGAVNRRRSINVNDFASIEVPIPPLAEQRKIAAVLSITQRAIEQQEKLIAFTTELKNASMHKFFTEGAHGEPQKQTEIGSVPKSWEVVPLSNICTFLSGGTPSKKRADYWEGHIPWVSPKDMKRERLTDVSDHVSKEAVKAGSAIAPAGAVLVVVRGMILVRDVPVCSLEVPMAFNQDVKAILPGGRVLPEFLLYSLIQFKSELARKVGRSAHGTCTLMSSEIARLQIPVPPLEEQAKISSALGILEEKSQIHIEQLKVLRELFRSLLHQLMTAQIRVDDLDLSALKVAFEGS